MTVSKEIPLNSFVSVICYSLLIYVKIERKIKHKEFLGVACILVIF